MQESQRRFKRSDGASHPYHAKFGVAQSAKYDFFFSAAGRARTPPPFLLADTDVTRRSRRAEPTETTASSSHTLYLYLSRDLSRLTHGVLLRADADDLPVHGG